MVQQFHGLYLLAKSQLFISSCMPPKMKRKFPLTSKSLSVHPDLNISKNVQEWSRFLKTQTKMGKVLFLFCFDPLTSCQLDYNGI